MNVFEEWIETQRRHHDYLLVTKEELAKAAFKAGMKYAQEICSDEAKKLNDDDDAEGWNGAKICESAIEDEVKQL